MRAAQQIEKLKNSILELKQEKPILDAFEVWLDSINENIVQKSNLSGAVTYALNHEEKFISYLEGDNCSISNNLAENSIRPFILGWYS